MCQCVHTRVCVGEHFSYNMITRQCHALLGDLAGMVRTLRVVCGGAWEEELMLNLLPAPPLAYTPHSPDIQVLPPPCPSFPFLSHSPPALALSLSSPLPVGLSLPLFGFPLALP